MKFTESQGNNQMKRILAIILLLCTLCFSGCRLSAEGINVEQREEYTKIVLYGFEGKQRIKIPHDSPNEGALYYKTDITGGSVRVFYDLGLLWDAEMLLEADAENNSVGGGYYIDNSVTQITIIVESDSSVTGQIYIGFDSFE